MRLLTLVSLLLVSFNAYSADPLFEASCDATNTSGAEPESAHIIGPLNGHEFRIQLFDHEGDKAGGGQCELIETGEAECYAEDSRVVVLSIELPKVRNLNQLQNEFSMVIDDDHSDYSSTWDCQKKVSGPNEALKSLVTRNWITVWQELDRREDEIGSTEYDLDSLQCLGTYSTEVGLFGVCTFLGYVDGGGPNGLTNFYIMRTGENSRGIFTKILSMDPLNEY